jgi:hypothetical protein
MERAKTPVFGESGYVGTVDDDEHGHELLLGLENGERLLIPRHNLRARPDGSLLLTLPIERFPRVIAVARVPIAEEQLSVEKVRRTRSRLRVHVQPKTREERIEVPLLDEHVETHHVERRRFVDSVPPIRQEGDTLIVPVMEEVLVVEKRLMLREELRIVRKQTTRIESHVAELRSEEVSIRRVDESR